MVRVCVMHEKYSAARVFEIDDWVNFSVDDGPQVALPAKGVEPVFVTARFFGLSERPHRVVYKTYQSFDTGATFAGVVCL